MLDNTNDKFREDILRRNLYIPDSEYPSSPSKVKKVMDSISAVSGIVLPYQSSLSISDTLVGRLTSGEMTPIVRDGLKYLAIHMGYNVADNLIRDELPVINFGAIFGKGKFISKNIDYQITKKTNSGILNNFLNYTVGYQSSNYSSMEYDSNESSYINKLIEITGDGQIGYLSKNISRNKYTFSSLNINSKSKKILNDEYNYEPTTYNEVSYYEYGDDKYLHIVENSNNRKLPDNFIWGVDDNIIDAKEGLLAYTKKIVADNKIYKGVKSGDGNKFNDGKRVKDKDGVISYNGSSLWNAPTNNPFGFEDGVRQHSAKDPYDKYAKAIRFDGNSVYNGSESSVINKSVLPKIHPTFKDDKVDNRNLMFSIENLAINVNSDGVVDNNTNIVLPKSEIGQNNGRLMWFPPYSIGYNESVEAKYDQTMMVGRGEPIYTYMNTTRSCTLNFTLLIDYPQQMKKLYGELLDNKKISEYFTYGIKDEKIKEYNEENSKRLINELDDINNKAKKIAPVDDLIGSDFYIYFPNNVPLESSVNTVFTEMFSSDYEIGIYSSLNNDYGLNKNIYNIVDYNYGTANNMNVKISANGATNGQYSYFTGNTNNDIDNNLIKFYSNINNRNYYDITITGFASKLGDSNYNVELGKRRAESVKKLIEERLKTIFPDDESILKDINIITNTGGEDNAVASEDININSLEAKKDRNVLVTIWKNSKSTVDYDLSKLSANDNIKRDDLIKQLADIKTNKGIAGNEYFTEPNKNSNLGGNSSIIENRFEPIFHSQTPEDFHRRLTFLQQCMRQGSAKNSDIKNSVFGRQPICVLRVGDHLHSKVVITNLTIDYKDAPWDVNPEGFGMQPMIAEVTLQMHIIGGQSLEGPINVLQNAISFNYYANSTFSGDGLYAVPTKVARKQYKVDEIEMEKFYNRDYMTYDPIETKSISNLESLVNFNTTNKLKLK